MEKTITFIKALSLKDATVNGKVISAITKGIVMSSDCTLLTEHGCYVSFSEQYGRKILNEVVRTKTWIVRRVAAASKVPIRLGLIREEKYTFQKNINKLVTWQNTLHFCSIPLKMRHWSLKTETWLRLRLNGKAKKLRGNLLCIRIKLKKLNAVTHKESNFYLGLI